MENKLGKLRQVSEPTEFGDSYLLKVLPRDVFDDGDGVVAVFTQPLLVLGQSYHTQPLPKVQLDKMAWMYRGLRKERESL